jgi:hypothetical protein
MIILGCAAVIGRSAKDAAEYLRSQMSGLPTPVSTEIKFSPDARVALGGKRAANAYRQEIYTHLQPTMH